MTSTTGRARWWSVLPWLLLLLGAAGFVAGRARAPAAADEPVAATFWEARGPDGGRRLPAPGASGLSLRAGDVVRLSNAEDWRFRLASLALTVRPESGASLLLSLREQGERSYALLVTPGGSPGLQLAYRSPGAPPAVLQQAPLPAAGGQPLELRVELQGDRFAVQVDGREALSCRDDRLAEGKVSLAVRKGNCRLEALAVDGTRTSQGGLVEPVTQREDFAPPSGATGWEALAASAGLAIGAVLVAALYLRALCRGRPGARRLAHAAALALAPVALLHAQGLFREPVLPGPVVAALGLCGLLLALRFLRADLDGAAPRSAGSRALGALVVLALAAAAVRGVFLAHEAVARPLLIAERLALAQPLAPPFALDGPRLLDAATSVVVPGPFRDFDLHAELVPAADSALELRLRATTPPSCRGVALWVPTDGRLRTGFVLEDSMSFEPLGAQLPAVRAGEPLVLDLRVRGREFAGTVNGQAVRAESLAFASGEVVLLAARGAAELRTLTIAPKPVAADELPEWSGWIGPALAPLLLVLGFAALAAALLRAPFLLLLEGGAFALLPVALGLLPGATPAPLTPAELAQLAGLVAALLLVPAFLRARGRPAWRGALLAAVAVAGAPVAVAAAHPQLFVTSWHSWSGERLEDDLAYLQHPVLRALNGYLADHRFRGRALPLRKPDGTRRVVTTGASTTYGFAVPDGTGREYPMILERLLNAPPPDAGPDGTPPTDAPRVEVINAAFLGSNSEQQLRLLRDALLAFEPDVVTLSLYYNDSFSLTGLDVADTVGRVCAPGYGRSLLDDALQAWKTSDAHARIGRLTGAYRGWTGSTQALWESLDLAPGERTPPERYESMLRRFAELGREHGFALVLIKEPVRDEHTVWKEEFYGAMDRVAAEYGLRVVDPGPALQAAGGTALYMDAVHLKPEGLAIMAQQLAPAVRACLQEQGR